MRVASRLGKRGPDLHFFRCHVINSNAELAALMVRAYEAQTAKNLDEAERLYRAALALNSRTFDALHMLGVVRLQKGDADEAARLLLSALPLLPQEHPAIYRNLGLCLSAVARNRNLIGGPASNDGAVAYRSFFRGNNLPARPAESPLVSIVLVCSEKTRFLDQAISSVANQTYRNIEFVVVEAGSGTERRENLRVNPEQVGFPVRVARAERAGESAALNCGVESARGNLVGIIEGAGLHRPDRVEKFVRILIGQPARWGFSNVAFVDGQSRPVRFGSDPHVDTVMREFDALYGCRALSAGLVERQHVVHAGNLFFERSLWQETGGFPDFPNFFAWAFALEAICLAEPAFLDEPSYVRRLPETSVSDQERESQRREASQIRALWEQRFWSSKAVSNAHLADTLISERRVNDFGLMANGRGHLIGRSRLLRHAAELGFEAALPA